MSSTSSDNTNGNIDIKSVKLSFENSKAGPSKATEVKKDQKVSVKLPYSETCPEGWKSSRKWCMIAFVLSILGQWSNCLLLPAIYSRLTDSLGFDASQLGLLHAMRLFSMFASLPLHAYLSQFYHRGVLMGISLILGGLLTILNIYGLTFGSFMAINILAGGSLGMVVPVTRSLIPNYYRLEDRGAAFGILEIAGGLGGFVGAGMGVIVTKYTEPFGNIRLLYDAAIDGTNVTWNLWVSNRKAFANATAEVASNISGCCFPWQTDFIILGTMTVILGILVIILVRDPIHENAMRKKLGDKLVLVFEGFQIEEINHDQEKGISISDLKILVKNKTWRIISIQGVFGCLPWSAFSFMILWFQRMDIDDLLAVIIFACVGGMAAAGGAVGGTVGDYFSKKSEWHHKYSRIIINHCSIFAGIPGALIFFLGLPYYIWWSYALFGLWFGFSVAWCPGNNAALMSDLFPQRLHPLSYAMQFWVEGSVSAFGPFLCAILNDNVFKTNELAVPMVTFKSFSVKKQEELLTGFGMSIMTVCCVGWFLCGLCYIPAYWTYPKESMHLQNLIKEEISKSSEMAEKL
jgi:MFS family permease